MLHPAKKDQPLPRGWPRLFSPQNLSIASALGTVLLAAWPIHCAIVDLIASHARVTQTLGANTTAIERLDERQRSNELRLEHIGDSVDSLAARFEQQFPHKALAAQP